MRIKEDFKTEDYYRSVLQKYEGEVALFKSLKHQYSLPPICCSMKLII